MSAIRVSAVILSCLALAVAAADAAEKAANKDKIVGTWEVVKGESDVKPGDTIEFTKDGKLTISAKVEGKPVTLKGTYTVDGDKLTVVLAANGQEHKEIMTLKTLTDKTLVTVDEKKKTDEFKKK
jgi:uncharacterized protein (TIGR03066 family)